MVKNIFSLDLAGLHCLWQHIGLNIKIAPRRFFGSKVLMRLVFFSWALVIGRSNVKVALIWHSNGVLVFGALKSTHLSSTAGWLLILINLGWELQTVRKIQADVIVLSDLDLLRLIKTDLSWIDAKEFHF